MTWLVWRRYRAVIGAACVFMLALGVSMAWQVHAFEAARRSSACLAGAAQCALASNHLFSLNVAVSVANVALAALPCALGVVFGAPLVAGELEHRTNRLVWTQGVSRIRWLLTKYVLLLLLLGTAVGALTLVTQWWSGHVSQSTLLLHALPGGKVGPGYFPVTGIVAVSYTVFAFTMGAAAGALLRKTGWAIFATIVVYVLVAVLMMGVRPNLAPKSFAPWFSHARVQYPGWHVPSGSWDLGSGYRYVAESEETRSRSANAVAIKCQRAAEFEGHPYFACLARSGVQVGEVYQRASNYWTLQWREAAMLATVSAVCLAGTVVAVRRWRG